jgi:hypothetical protein
MGETRAKTTLFARRQKESPTQTLLQAPQATFSQ